MPGADSQQRQSGRCLDFAFMGGHTQTSVPSTGAPTLYFYPGGSPAHPQRLAQRPPPGLGLSTVTEAVLAMAMSDTRMLTVNRELLTNVVTRALPFQFTTDPETKPVPFTVRVNPGPPGAVASGTSGWLMSGTGFTAPAVAIVPVTDLLNPAKRPIEQRAKPIKTRRLKKADREVDCFFIDVSFHLGICLRLQV